MLDQAKKRLNRSQNLSANNAVSRSELDLNPMRPWRLAALATPAPRSVRVAVRTAPTEAWVDVAQEFPSHDIVMRPRSLVRQLRIEMAFESGADAALDDIAVVPGR